MESKKGYLIGNIHKHVIINPNQYMLFSGLKAGIPVISRPAINVFI